MFNENGILIKELKKGNEAAYKQLYDMYYRSLVIYCFKLTNKLPLAEDIVQNTFIKIWTNREKITINSSLKSYLFRAVYNGFASEYNKKQREDKTLIQLKNEALNELIELDNEALEKKIKLLDAAIEKLPKKCKNVFLLNKKQGYSHKEIASQLDISEKTVEKHISRAIFRIKKMLSSKMTLINLLLFRKVFSNKSLNIMSFLI